MDRSCTPPPQPQRHSPASAKQVPELTSDDTRSEEKTRNCYAEAAAASCEPLHDALCLSFSSASDVMLLSCSEDLSKEDEDRMREGNITRRTKLSWSPPPTPHSASVNDLSVPTFSPVRLTQERLDAMCVQDILGEATVLPFTSNSREGMLDTAEVPVSSYTLASPSSIRGYRRVVDWLKETSAAHVSCGTSSDQAASAGSPPTKGQVEAQHRHHTGVATALLRTPPVSLHGAKVEDGKEEARPEHRVKDNGESITNVGDRDTPDGSCSSSAPLPQPTQRGAEAAHTPVRPTRLSTTSSPSQLGLKLRQSGTHSLCPAARSPSPLTGSALQAREGRLQLLARTAPVHHGRHIQLSSQSRGNAEDKHTRKHTYYHQQQQEQLSDEQHEGDKVQQGASSLLLPSPLAPPVVLSAHFVRRSDSPRRSALSSFCDAAAPAARALAKEKLNFNLMVRRGAMEQRYDSCRHVHCAPSVVSQKETRLSSPLPTTIPRTKDGDMSGKSEEDQQWSVKEALPVLPNLKQHREQSITSTITTTTTSWTTSNAIALRVCTLSGFTLRVVVDRRLPLAVLVDRVAGYLHLQRSQVQLKYAKTGAVFESRIMTEALRLCDLPQLADADVFIVVLRSTSCARTPPASSPIPPSPAFLREKQQQQQQPQRSPSKAKRHRPESSNDSPPRRVQKSLETAKEAVPTTFDSPSLLSAVPPPHRCSAHAPPSLHLPSQPPSQEKEKRQQQEDKASQLPDRPSSTAAAPVAALTAAAAGEKEKEEDGLNLQSSSRGRAVPLLGSYGFPPLAGQSWATPSSQ